MEQNSWQEARKVYRAAQSKPKWRWWRDLPLAVIGAIIIGAAACGAVVILGFACKLLWWLFMRGWGWL